MTDLAYLAGIVDGEGCITITENMKGGRNYYRLVLDITNTSYDLMQWLEDTFSHTIRTSYYRSTNRTDMYGWTASGNQAQDLLRLILPYLIIKKPQAEIALEMNIAPYGGGSNHSYSADEEEWRKCLCNDIHRMNKRNGNKGSYIRSPNYTQKEVNAPSR